MCHAVDPWLSIAMHGYCHDNVIQWAKDRHVALMLK